MLDNPNIREYVIAIGVPRLYVPGKPSTSGANPRDWVGIVGRLRCATVR